MYNVFYSIITKGLLRFDFFLLVCFKHTHTHIHTHTQREREINTHTCHNGCNKPVDDTNHTSNAPLPEVTLVL